MAHKWDSIGIQLEQAERVSQLRNSPEPNEKKIQDILDAWMESTGRGLINTRPLLNVLRSSDVGLRDVAEDLEKVCRLHGCLQWVHGMHMHWVAQVGEVCGVSQFPHSCTHLGMARELMQEWWSLNWTVKYRTRWLFSGQSYTYIRVYYYIIF